MRSQRTSQAAATGPAMTMLIRLNSTSLCMSRRKSSWTMMKMTMSIIHMPLLRAASPPPTSKMITLTNLRMRAARLARKPSRQLSLLRFTRPHMNSEPAHLLARLLPRQLRQPPPNSSSMTTMMTITLTNTSLRKTLISKYK